jgi:hypothetical protein
MSRWPGTRFWFTVDHPADLRQSRRGHLRLGGGQRSQGQWLGAQVAARPAPAATASAAWLRPQSDGTLNQGCFEDYGRTQVPELERQMTRLLAAMGVNE